MDDFAHPRPPAPTRTHPCPVALGHQSSHCTAAVRVMPPPQRSAAKNSYVSKKAAAKKAAAKKAAAKKAAAKKATAKATPAKKAATKASAKAAAERALSGPASVTVTAPDSRPIQSGIAPGPPPAIPSLAPPFPGGSVGLRLSRQGSIASTPALDQVYEDLDESRHAAIELTCHVERAHAMLMSGNVPRALGELTEALGVVNWYIPPDQ